jgi:hypothetical protein
MVIRAAGSGRHLAFHYNIYAMGQTEQFIFGSNRICMIVAAGVRACCPSPGARLCEPQHVEKRRSIRLFAVPERKNPLVFDLGNTPVRRL